MRTSPDAVIAQATFERRERLATLEAHRPGQRRVAPTGDDLGSGVGEERSVDTYQCVGGYPRGDVTRSCPCLVREERGQRFGVARHDLVLTGEQGGALGDHASETGELFNGVWVGLGEQPTRCQHEATEGCQDRLA